MSAHTLGQVVAGTQKLNGSISLKGFFHGVMVEGSQNTVALTGFVDGGGNHDGLAAADARRIAACWNACIGIDTKELEVLGPFCLVPKYKALTEQLAGANAEIRKVEMFNDANSAALQAANVRIVMLNAYLATANARISDLEEGRCMSLDAGNALMEQLADANAQIANWEDGRSILVAAAVSQADHLREAHALLREILAADEAAISELKALGFSPDETDPLGITGRIRALLAPFRTAGVAP